MKKSFYQGSALLVVPVIGSNEVWRILEILYIDTADDKNINAVSTNYAFQIGTAIIQSTLVAGYSSNTKKIKRTFKEETGLEYWEAM